MVLGRTCDRLFRVESNAAAKRKTDSVSSMGIYMYTPVATTQNYHVYETLLNLVMFSMVLISYVV